MANYRDIENNESFESFNLSEDLVVRSGPIKSLTREDIQGGLFVEIKRWYEPEVWLYQAYYDYMTYEPGVNS